MTITDDRTLPAALAEVAGSAFDYAEDGIDYEPFDAFLAAEETADWLLSWTGNPEADAAAFRVFGQDGTGGYAAFWLVRPGRPVAEQPVVFLGSEGEAGVAAGSLADLLWLLAAGLGPLEAVEYPDRPEHPMPALAAIAERHAPGARRPAAEIVAAAQAEFPGFEEYVDGLCG
ncbi:SMI1/KNR4 family protein [Kitasatospora sp. NPDC048540]|uniref:hypothetical protein n=1 Tax=unclassified Kitasatospora TaxID=2633591 RepID=UPI00053B6EEE|nr:hypothetical protein [Kitasatospora sp. MBT63]